MSCEVKATFKTEVGARQELRRLRRKAVDYARLNVFWCDKHNGCHIGNRPIPSLKVLQERHRRADGI